jgi:hypothetical protein
MMPHLESGHAPHKVDINRTHRASQDYPVSPLWTVNSLTHTEAISLRHQADEA